MTAGVRSWLAWAGLLARRCLACGDPAGEGSPLCPACAEALAPWTRPRCRLCGLELSTPLADLCGPCAADPPPWDALHFYGRYDGLLRELILDYKYRKRLGLGRLLIRMAAEARPDGASLDLTVPVPLHPSRLRWRGFNQSRELSRLAARRAGAPVRDAALARTRRTPPQSGLDKGQRRANIRGAIRADEGLVRGKSVLLVDDVLTTGATLAECARVLGRAGASRIEVLVLGRA
jgi:ComF family protein